MTSRPWTVVAALALLARAAQAQPAPKHDLNEAKHHYEEGSKAYDLGDFQSAAAEYKKAYSVTPEPVLLYNIAQAYRLANDLPNAIFFYRSYLRRVPSASNRREVEDRTRKLENLLAEQKAPPNSAARPDAPAPPAHHTAEETRASEPPPVAPSAPPAPPPMVVTIPAAAAPSRRLIPDTPTAVMAIVVAPAPARVPVYKKWWFWTIVGVAAAGVAVGAGVGVTESRGRNAPPSSQIGVTPVYF